VVVTGLWQQKIAQGLANPNLSDFQRQVLSDYVITDAEYRESLERYIQCMADLGWVAVSEGSGFEISAAPGNVNEPGSEQEQSDHMSCATKTIAYIQPIYLGMQSESSDSDHLVAANLEIRACYMKYGITDGAGLSDDAFSTLMDDPNYWPSTPQADLCWMDPREETGVTPEQAAEYIKSRVVYETTVTFPDNPSESPSVSVIRK